MTIRAMSRGGRTPAHWSLPRFFGLATLSTLLTVSHAADDPYLQLLDEEVTKVEGVSTDTERDGATAVVKTSASRPASSREQFESQLRQQHVGTYSFYRRLPERNREEVFLDYNSGVSMEALREKVIDRFLHP
jgi:hypothetical protein